MIDYLSETTGTKISLTIKIFTKNRDEDTTTDGTVVKDSSNNDYSIVFSSSDWGPPTSPVVKQMLVESTATANQGLLELVRFKFTVTDGEPGEYLVVRMFPPIFFDAAN